MLPTPKYLLSPPLCLVPGLPALIVLALPCLVCAQHLFLDAEGFLLHSESKLNPIWDFKAHTQGALASRSLLFLSATACPSTKGFGGIAVA